jgi:hypothetical protein
MRTVTGDPVLSQDQAERPADDPGPTLRLARGICLGISAGTGFSLAEGALGSALACQLTGKACADREVIERGRQHLTQAVRRWQRDPGPGLGLFSGYAGFGWVLSEFAAADARYQESLNRVAVRLATAVLDEAPSAAAAMAYRQRDVIDGWAGQLACVLRLRRSVLPAAVRRLVDQAASKLIGLLAFPAQGGGDPVAATFVPTPAHGSADWYRQLYPYGHYPLGMAHGAAGVVAVLSVALLDGAGMPGLAAAVGRLASWLAGCQGCGGPQSWGSALGADPESGQPVPDARFRVPSGWCNGTSGVAAALLAAAEAGDLPELASVAGQALRTDEARGRGREVRDTVLCHGSAGRALIYLRAAGLLHDQDLRRESERQFGAVISGRSGWPESDGLLTGKAGIACALALSAGGDGHRLPLLG